MMKTTLTLSTVLLGSALFGCVSRSEHERLLALAAEQLQLQQARAAQDLGAAQSNAVTLQGELARLKQEIEGRDAEIGSAQAKIAGLEKKLDEGTALSQGLTDELKKAGRNVDSLMAEKGKIATTLQETKARLEELRRAQEAAQKRAALLTSLVAKLKRMIDAGELRIVMREGRMVLELRNDVLFDSGRADVKAAGKAALKEVALVLATLTDRKLQVAGHTDNKPMASPRFASNWELSAERAIAVVRLLLEQGVKAEAISAAGYSEHDPVAPNDTDEGRAKNRRIEIILLPNLAELVNVTTAE
ncbi:MAG: hypothetical protein EXR75_15435 [Myxococcales bacterium]|nr:hypothetical protein [Myxococcales bacterium]